MSLLPRLPGTVGQLFNHDPRLLLDDEAQHLSRLAFGYWLPPALKVLTCRSLLVELKLALAALVPEDRLPVRKVPPLSVATVVVMLVIAVWACAGRFSPSKAMASKSAAEKRPAWNGGMRIN